MRSVGILALQGDFSTHAAAFAARGIATREVRREHELETLAAIVLPGGESSVLWHFFESEKLAGPIRARIEAGLPCLATCAGLVVIASEVVGREQPCLGVLDVSVVRNGYGRQFHSAVRRVSGRIGFPDSEGVFIRAPRITRVGTGVEVLGTLGEEPCILRKGRVLATSFHPELSAGHPVIDLFVQSLAAPGAEARTLRSLESTNR